MAIQGIRKSPFMFIAPTDMETNRFVVLTDATQTVAYAVDGTISGVTVGSEENEVISVQAANNVTDEFWIELGGTVTLGMDVIATTDGKAVDGSGAGVFFVKTAGITGDTVAAYAKLS